MTVEAEEAMSNADRSTTGSLTPYQVVATADASALAFEGARAARGERRHGHAARLAVNPPGNGRGVTREITRACVGPTPMEELAR